jgi:hypothetical protein
MIQIKLHYLSGSGCEWLEEIHEVPEGNRGFELAKSLVRDYYERTHEDAERLTHRWVVNGEDEYDAELTSHVEVKGNQKIWAHCLNNLLENLED